MTRCPKCGFQLVENQEESSLVIKCTNCEYSVVTTSINQIYEDDTVYSIVINTGNNVNKDTMALLMNITGMNIAGASNILKNQCPYELFSGNAVQIKELSKKLEEKGFIFHVTPDYKW